MSTPKATRRRSVRLIFGALVFSSCCRVARSNDRVDCMPTIVGDLGGLRT